MKKILFAAPLQYTSSIKLGGHQYAKQFSTNGWEVYYFSNPLSPFNICFSKYNGDIAERLNIYWKGGIYFNKVWTYVPLTLVPHHNNVPLLNRKIFLDNYYRFTTPSVKSVLRNKKIDKVDILWMDCSNQSYWTKIIKYNNLIYRIPDNIFAFKKISKAYILSHYELMDKADVILMPSKLLMDNRENAGYREKIIYCPNGVDLSNFNRVNYPMPEEYKLLKNKHIALYVGTIDEWFDFKLLKSLGEKCSETNFVIIGPQNVRIPDVTGRNIIFLGKQDYQKIPLFIYHCDFGIIPFKNNDLVKYVNPIKMYEFLALGKPLVSVVWDELKNSNAPIYLANNYSEFILIVNNLEKDRRVFKRTDLISFAKNNTWEARYKLILKKLSITS